MEKVYSAGYHCDCYVIRIKPAKKENASEAAGGAVTLRIENGRVKGFTYEMMKALVESDDVVVYSDSTGPFGEDEGAEVFSTSPKDATGEYDMGDGDVERPEDCKTLVVLDRDVGQSDCNWSGFDEDEGNEGENIYILASALPMATTIWHSKKFI